MHRAQSIHLDSVTSPPFFVNMSVAWVGHARLQIPHLVHLCSSFSSLVRAMCLKGVKELNKPVKAPRGQIRHQNRRYANERIITIAKIVRFILEIYPPTSQNGSYTILEI